MVTMALRRARLACLALLVNIILLSPGPRGRVVLFSSVCLRYGMIAVLLLLDTWARCAWRSGSVVQFLKSLSNVTIPSPSCIMFFGVVLIMIWPWPSQALINVLTVCMFLRLAIVSPSIVVYFGILINILTV